MKTFQLIMTKHVFIYFYFLLFFKFITANEYAILAVNSSSEKESFCVKIFKEFSPLPEEKSKPEFHIIDDASSTNWCTDVKNDSNGKILILTKNDCSITEQASNVQSQGGKSVLFITPKEKVASYTVNDTFAAGNTSITVGLIEENSIKKLKSMGYPLSGHLFIPFNDGLNFDFSPLVLFAIAFFTVAIGSYWSGHVHFAIYYEELRLLPGGNEKELPNTPKVKALEGVSSSINVKPYDVAIFVLCMSGSLLLFYFFFDYLVYFLIFLFVSINIDAVYRYLEPLVLKIPKFLCTFGNIDFCELTLWSFAISLPIWWIVIKHLKYSWILQDVLGVTFCIHMLKYIRLPSLKICTVLLVLLFFHDIFFVFVTPFMTENGKSVTEEVATGGNSEQINPMVFRVAHLRFDALAVCYEQFSILGFGDILIPGFLISYCHTFDLITSEKMLYFCITVAAYGIGLVFAAIGSLSMSTAQPALLYLVPTTLIPTILLGLYRGEFSLLWNGFKVNQ